MKIGIITQARTTSTRLPNKIFKTIKQRPLLDFHLERLRASGLETIVATTTNATDEPVIAFCRARGVPFFRGDETDVLGRFQGAAVTNKLDAIVRVTSDCPLIDGELIARAAGEYLEWNDPKIFYSNCRRRTFPRGMDFEIMSFAALNHAAREAKSLTEREHVTTYIRANKGGTVIERDFTAAVDASDLRLTVDEEPDFLLIKELIEKYGADRLSCAQIVELFFKNPELKKINSSVEQKKG